MKNFLIQYRLKDGSQADWHAAITRFISQLDSDPDLKGKISYRCLKGAKDFERYHFVEAVDDQTVKLMQQRDFFKRFGESLKAAADGALEALPLEIVAKTQTALF